MFGSSSRVSWGLGLTSLSYKLFDMVGVGVSPTSDDLLRRGFETYVGNLRVEKCRYVLVREGRQYGYRRH